MPVNRNSRRAGCIAVGAPCGAINSPQTKAIDLGRRRERDPLIEPWSSGQRMILSARPDFDKANFVPIVRAGTAIADESSGRASRDTAGSGQAKSRANTGGAPRKVAIQDGEKGGRHLPLCVGMVGHVCRNCVASGFEWRRPLLCARRAQQVGAICADMYWHGALADRMNFLLATC